MSQNETVAADAPDARAMPPAPGAAAAPSPRPAASDVPHRPVPSPSRSEDEPRAKAPAATSAATSSSDDEPGELTLTGPYRPRAVKSLGVLERDGWRIKVTGISHDADEPRAELVAAARTVAARTLPKPAHTDGRHGLGFLGIHDGPDVSAVFVAWWTDESELHLHRYTAPAETPTELKKATASAVAADTWDLAVIAHERRAWVDAVLAFSDGPDVGAYLDRTLDGRI